MGRFYVFLILGFLSLSSQGQNNWMISNPVFSQGESGSVDEIAVKDPSLVSVDGKWHVFYTARSQNEYTTAYVNTTDLQQLNKAKRYELKQIRGKTRYGCAPQVFYFEPQKKWYLIFQNKDSNYQPAYSTNDHVDRPEQWSASKDLVEKDSKKKWIDFWVIADQDFAYLFYTRAHGGVMMRKTTLDDFPERWEKAKKVFDNVHEAVHIYKVKDQSEYHMIYELNHDGIRSFGLATSTSLDGTWKRVTDTYATGSQLVLSERINSWTDMVSHGEALRSGYDQSMEYEPDNCQWLIQGIKKSSLNLPYPMLPWQLGIISKH